MDLRKTPGIRVKIGSISIHSWSPVCHSPPKERRLTKRLEIKPRVTNDKVKQVGLDCQYIVNWIGQYKTQTVE